MIGLDTNVLVRYFTQDDPVQAAAATYIIEIRLSPQQPGFISLVTLVELAWVLARRYHVPPAALAAIMERILTTDRLQVQSKAAVFTAAALSGDGRASSADALVGALAAEAGCATTLTFDRRAARLPGFRLVG